MNTKQKLQKLAFKGPQLQTDNFIPSEGEAWGSLSIKDPLQWEGVYTLLVPAASYNLCSPVTYSSVQSIFVRAVAQLHAKAIVKTLPVFPFQMLSFSKSESSILADIKTDFSDLKTWEALLILLR